MMATLLAAGACKKTEQSGSTGRVDAGKSSPEQPVARDTPSERASTGIRGVSLGIDLAGLRTALPHGEHLIEQPTREIVPKGKGANLLDILNKTCRCYLPGTSFHLRVPIFGKPAVCDFHFALDERLSAVTCRLDTRDEVDAYLALVRDLVARLTEAYGAPATVPADPEDIECGFGARCDKVWTWKTAQLMVELSSVYGEVLQDLKLAVMTPAHARLEQTLARLAERQCRRAAGRKKEPVCVGVPAITPHEIAMVVRAHRHQVRDCYREALARKPELSGRMMAQFEMTDEGTQVSIAETNTNDEAFEACVLEALKAMRFPPLRYRIGQTVRARYPFSFRPERPGGAPPPSTVAYQDGKAFEVTESEGQVTITLPDAARAALAKVHPGHRLLATGDFAAGAPGFPFPFAIVSNLDKWPGDDLALLLASRKEPGSFRLVVLHGGGHPPAVVADSSEMLPFFRARPGKRPSFFLTSKGRCFCERHCVSLASDLGRSFEFSRDNTGYTGQIEDYLPD